MSEDRNDAPVWAKIDFGRDAIVEASAGTGKTYTLERIVLRLVAEAGVPIGRILLVTFTEKAAGELRDRIRSAVERRLAGAAPGSEEERLLEKALRGFDDATISTIHSFCQRVLREYAFENGLPMASETVASDALGSIARKAVLDALRSPEFRDRWSGSFDDLMDQVCGDGADPFVDAVSRSVAAFRSRDFDAPTETLVPELIRFEADEIRRAFREAEERGSDVGALASALDGAALHGSDRDRAAELYAGLPALRDGLAAGGDCRAALAAAKKIRFDLAGARNPRVTGRGKGARLSDVRPEATALCAELAEAVRGHVAEANRLAGSESVAAFLVDLFDRSVAAFRRRVDDACLLSYDDMVRKTAEVVARPESAPLLAKLREAYHVALVDEFQDTDGLQWDIFRTLFRHAAALPAGGAGRTDGTRLLIAVGDPKQAIYGFRGADVETYLAARSELERDQKEKLPASFRSPKPLLDAFNRLFSDPSWFDPPAEDGTDGNGIVYHDVLPPPPDAQKRYRDGDPDGTGRGPVTLLESLPARYRDAQGDDSPGHGRGTRDACLPFFARNAAAEIGRLLGLGDGAYVFRDKDGGVVRTRFRPGDFCVLVRAKHEARAFQRELDALGIRHSFYKETGLYASAEAESVLALLDFAAAPQRRGLRAAALLTPFFGVRLGGLDAALSADPPEVARLVRKWTDLAAQRRWSRLFDSFVFDTRIWRPAGPDDAGFDRRIAGVRQILDDLLAAKASSALVLEDFADALRALRDGDASAGEDGELREKETEEDRVQIMTMHASKGLEFPVVLVPFGFSPMLQTLSSLKPASAMFPCGPDGRRRRVFRIAGGPLEGRILRAAEEEALRDLRRLLYVALTRARMKLYLPWSAFAGEAGIGSKGSALRGGFLCSAILRLFGGVQEAAGAVAEPAGGDPRLLPASPPEAFADLAPAGASQSAEAPETPAPLPEEPGGDLFGRRLRWDSFSSLHRDAAAPGAAPPEPEGEARQTTDEGGAEPVVAAADSLVPRGTLAGTVFHAVMEALCGGADEPGSPGFVSVGSADDFDALWNGGESDLAATVAAAMRAGGLADREGEDGRTTARALGRMAWAALRAPLPDAVVAAGGPRRLADVSRADRRAEVSFVVSEKTAAPAGTGRDGALNGSVDLLFRAAPGKPFFLLDWKTNALPGGVYGEAEAAAAMDACGYRLQYRLYALAVADWLGGEASLGGAVYLFVRGGESGPGPAVFHETFAPGWRAAFRDEVSAALANSR